MKGLAQKATERTDGLVHIAEEDLPGEAAPIPDDIMTAAMVLYQNKAKSKTGVQHNKAPGFRRGRVYPPLKPDPPIQWPPRHIGLPLAHRIVASKYNPLSWPFRLMSWLDEKERGLPTIGDSPLVERLKLLESIPDHLVEPSVLAELKKARKSY